MEHLSKEKKKNVPPAEESKVVIGREELRDESEKEFIRQQTDELTKDVPEKPVQEGTAETEFELPFNLSGVDPKKLEMADNLLKGTGFSIRDLAEWANGVEIRLQAIQKNLPESVEKAVVNAIQTIQKQQAEAIQKARQLGGGGGGGSGGGGMGLKELIPLISGGGGGMDEEMQNLVKETLRSNIDFTKSIRDAIISKITGKAVGDAIKEIAK